MSATGRGASRKDGDTYYTDQRVADALVATLPVRPDWTWLEPSVGGGAFVRALRARHGRKPVRILGIDIDRRAAGLSLCDGVGIGDFLGAPIDTAVDAIVGNPPYSGAEAHVRRALQVVRLGGLVAFLLRLAFLESAERIAFWADNRPERVTVLQERPSFTGGGTDNCAYGFFVWRAGIRPDHTRLEWLSWKSAAAQQPALAAAGEERSDGSL